MVLRALAGSPQNFYHYVSYDRSPRICGMSVAWCIIIYKEKGRNMWQLEANCTEDQQDLFFSQSKSKMESALKICKSCSVKKECLRFALNENVEFGIFGGKTPEERKVLTNVGR